MPLCKPVTQVLNAQECIDLANKAKSVDGMTHLSGGAFSMGSDNHYPEERPIRQVSVDSFQIDTLAVSNDAFAAFVNDTGYKTTAELPLDPRSLPAAYKEDLAAGSLVFQMSIKAVPLDDFRNWWLFVPGACWYAPEGPGSSIKGREDHPVVQVSYFDAQAYANWAGKSLPTEKEWEFASQGGAQTEFPWGETLTIDGIAQANTWFGNFPFENTLHPLGPPFTVPVGHFQPNRSRLYNMIGNVWEWTCSPFQETKDSTCCTPHTSLRDGDMIIVKGGSHLCAPCYCRRYRSPARSPQESRSSTSHIGFRCVVRE